MPRRQIGDAHEWIEEIPTVPPIYLTIEREIQMYEISRGISTFKWKEYNFSREIMGDRIDT